MPSSPSRRTPRAPAPEISLPFAAEDLRTRLMAWYRRHARELPWRGVQDPYATWLSEIMLQQTRVAAVIDRYQQFLARFPTITALAEAQEDDVLALWSGLGYYRRARMLHRGAQFVARELGGRLPSTCAELRTLPGIGGYTAAAIASIAFGESVAVLDGNVERVLLRLLGLPEDPSTRGQSYLQQVAQQLIPPALKRRSKASNPPGDHNQAMMELGATLCLPRSPLCLQCPVAELCQTRGEHTTAPREPQQLRVIAHLVALRKRGITTEVLLHRRPASASLMPGMLELPPLPLEAAEGREPVLRLRHAITNTNYNVLIFTESAPGSAAPIADPDTDAFSPEPEDVDNIDTAVFVATPEPSTAAPSPTLQHSIPSSASDLEWVQLRRLPLLPLTGLARKTLQRLDLLPTPKLQLP